jgi:hypothetical protein
MSSSFFQFSLEKFEETDFEVEALEDPLCRLRTEFEIKDSDGIYGLEELIYLFESYQRSGIYLSYFFWCKNMGYELLCDRIIKLRNE